VAVEAIGGTIRIRTGNLILAEHPRCLIRDARVEDPTHLKERRDLSTLPAPSPPQRAPVFLFDHEVEVQARPLSFYQRSSKISVAFEQLAFSALEQIGATTALAQLDQLA